MLDTRSGLRGIDYLDILETQFLARHLDLEARRMKSRGTGFYTIGSAGHEGNAAVAAALKPTDPAFLHYRSGAFFAQRAKQVDGETPTFDVLLSLCASSEDPIAGGRHKVFGSRRLWVPPQTSTIASHLPKAMGAAFALGRAARLGATLPVPEDAIVMCSFGDASANHATALAGLNSSAWAAYQHLPMPILFVCEDNGIGVSVPTPRDWVESVWGNYPGLSYLRADGSDLVDTYRAATEAVARCRSRRVPVFLHLDTVRLLGHAGADVELTYHSVEQIQEAEARDPLLHGCRQALRRELASADELLACYLGAEAQVSSAAREAERRPRLQTAAQVAAPLAQHTPSAVSAEATRAGRAAARSELFGGEDKLPESQNPEPLGRLINWGLLDLLAKYPEMVLFGEDVGRRGGVYGITTKLQERAGSARVFNTLLDEQTILGTAIGAGQMGLLPVPEIQYLAYYQHAQDQIRGEAGSLAFFSQGQFRNPMVVRIAGWAYQKGFGGHFHNDNAVAALRDVPGILIASPARGEDAVGMLRTAMAAARVDGRIVLFLEPIALYRTRHLHSDGDDLWADRYPSQEQAVPLGKARVYRAPAAEAPSAVAPADLTIVSWSNGLWLSLQAAQQLAEKHGLRAEVIDLRWLAPIDIDTVQRSAATTGRVLVVDEGRRTGGVAETVITSLVERATADSPAPAIARYAAADCYSPLGQAAELMLPSRDGIVQAAHALCNHAAAGVPAVEPPEATLAATARGRSKRSHRPAAAVR